MAKKLKSTLPNMIIVLGLITAIMGVLLGYVYNVTKDPIAAVQKEKINKAIQEVVPGFDSLSESYRVAALNDPDSLTFFDCYKNGEWMGTAVETFDKNGFSGLIKIMVGFNTNGDIIKTATLKHSETPGLGEKMDNKKSDFSAQFSGKNPDTFKLTVKKDGGEVDAITAATISSRAYCRSLDRAYQAFKAQKGGVQ
ncbi:MAG: RnfABCDGE type electron transport complex subunit G [Bacteroidales bacterium]|nr:RnfABCDGE type electron transport complex subunit G [Bacteroidales bacterium]